MDEESDSAKNWVLVDQVDCTANDSTSKPELDWERESEDSISIISDHPTDSFSDDEPESLQRQPNVFIGKEATIMTENEKNAEKLGLQHSQVSTTDGSGENDETITEDIAKVHQNIEHDVSSTSGSSTFDALMDEEPLSESEQFYPDCYKAPILENSDSDAECISDAETSNKLCLEAKPANQQEQKHELIKKPDYPVSRVEPKEPSTSTPISKIGIGVLISVLVLVGSHIIQLYSECQDDAVQGLNDNILERLADNDKAKEFLKFCIDRQKMKGEFSEQAVEKCAMKKLRKKNREEVIKKTEMYLQKKEKQLALREKELVEKEKEIIKKWRKWSNDGQDISDPKKRNADYKTPNENTKKFDKNKIRNWHEDSEKERFHTYESDKRVDKFFRKKEKHCRENTEKNQKPSVESKEKSFHKKVKQSSANDEKYSKENIDNDHRKNYKPSFKIVKEKIEKFREQHKKDTRILYHDEEWYIKYNPMKNTIELINITTLPEQDSQLIKKGNKTINGQWYFSLYGTSRETIRSKEKAADWYFKRGYNRENKRDKAKWYFDYMSSREDIRF